MKNYFNKICLSFMVLMCFSFFINSAYAHSLEAIKFYNLGTENIKRENYVQAAKNLEKAIFEDASLKDAYFNLGFVYKQLGKTDESKEILNKLIRQDPSDDEAVFFLGKLYFDTEDYKKAEFFFRLISDSSEKYNKAQELALLSKEKQEEKTILEKKSVREWKKKILPDFNGPAGVVSDSKGNIYVANFKNGIIQKICPDVDDNKNFSNENIKGPIGLAVDSFDNIYVSNYLKNNIIKITPEEEISIILDDIEKPYYLFIRDDILYITEQSENSLIMLNLWEIE